MLRFIIVVLLGHTLALDVPNEFSLWVQDNSKTTYRLYENQEEKLLEIKLKADHPTLSYKRHDRMLFVQTKDTPRNTWFLLPRAQKEHKSEYHYKSNAPCFDDHKISPLNKKITIIWHGDSAHTFNRVRQPFSLREQTFHSGLSLYKIRCWQNAGGKFLLSVFDKTDGSLKALSQGDSAYLETLNWQLISTSPRGYTIYKTLESTSKFIKYKQGRKLGISADGVNFTPLDRYAEDKMPYVVQETLQKYSPELLTFPWGSPCLLFGSNKPLKRGSRSNSVPSLTYQRIGRKQSKEIVRGLKKIDLDFNQQADDLWNKQTKSAR